MTTHYEATKSNTFFRVTPQQLEEKTVKGLCYNNKGYNNNSNGGFTSILGT